MILWGTARPMRRGWSPSSLLILAQIELLFCLDSLESGLSDPLNVFGACGSLLLWDIHDGRVPFICEYHRFLLQF